MPFAFYIVFGATFMAAVSTALGKLLLRQLSAPLYREEEHVLGFLVGTPILSTLTFLLCTVDLARKGVFLSIGGVILAWAWSRGVHRPIEKRLLRDGIPLVRQWKWIFGAIVVVYLAVYLCNAMAPEMSPDGTTYHLALVARYFREHGFHRITTNMYANLSQGVEMLFLFAFAFGRHSAAAMVHLLFLLALPLLMALYGRRAGFPMVGACAALFVFLSPIAGIDGVSAYNDVAVACIAFAIYYLLQVWDGAKDRSLLIPIGLLAGFGYAVKYTAFVAVPYAAGFIAWRLWRARKPLMKPLLVVSSCALLVMIPWVAKNWIWVGNPFSPFFNSLFPNPYVHVGFERQYVYDMRHYSGIRSYWQIPFAVTTSGALGGLLGPLFLLAPIGLLALRRQAGRQVMLAALIFGIPYAANVGTRFLLPPLPFVALGMAMAFAGVRGLAPVLVLVQALICWPAVTPMYCIPPAWRIRQFPWKAALRIQPEDDFLTRYLRPYPMVRFLEREVPEGGKVFAFTPTAESYTSRDIIVGYQSAQGQRLEDILWTAITPGNQPTSLLRFRFPSQTLRRIRVVQTAGGSSDYWSVSEFRLFRGSAELPRTKRWRLHAWPNPWEVRLAFDHSPVTRWRSWQRLFPGMYLEADFGKPEPIDSVMLECSPGQNKIRLKVDGQDSSGRWATLASAPVRSEGPAPREMRRAATAELKSRGIDYILVDYSDYGADDFRLRPERWGVTPVGEFSAVRLYKIN